MIVYQYLWATHKCESVRSYQLLICFMFHNLQWQKRSTSGTRDFFSLCVSVHRYWAIVRPLQLSNIVTTTATGGKFNGAADDANPTYMCQTWLSCPSSYILAFVSSQAPAYRMCFLQELRVLPATTSVRDDTGVTQQRRQPGEAPTSPLAAATCCRSCAAPSPQRYDWLLLKLDWGTQLD